jgi:hypothetical protein
MPPPQQQTIFSCSLESPVWGTDRTAHPTATTDFPIVFIDKDARTRRRFLAVDAAKMT